MCIYAFYRLKLKIAGCIVMLAHSFASCDRKVKLCSKRSEEKIFYKRLLLPMNQIHQKRKKKKNIENVLLHANCDRIDSLATENT